MRKTVACGILLFAGLLVGTAQGQSLNDQLLSAAYSGDKAKVDALIASGADVNAKDARNGHDALLYATLGSKTDVVELLIAKGADVNAKVFNGATPLFSAKTREIAEFLIAKGADVNAKDNSADMYRQ